MKRFILLLISSCAMLFAYSQEEIVLDSLSTVKPKVEMNGLVLEKPLFFDGSVPANGIIQLDMSMFHQPLLPDYSKNFDFKKYLDNPGLKIESFSSSGGFTISPFLTGGIVYNQASYRLNDRFSFGGSSFGAQSVFDVPKMNPNIQDMSIKGASMFLQYKVSDHFKIETRVSVTNHSSPLER